jgi:hypothetical protein
MTWEEIADALRKETQTTITRQGVQDYFKRRRAKKLRIPMGMEPEVAQETVQTPSTRLKDKLFRPPTLIH